MAFDGIVMAALGKELSDTIVGGVISKIAMPEKDELLITIRNNGNNYRLLVSAGASLPLIYLTEENKNSPLTAPAFCMLLRKYIGNGKILNVHQQGLERIMVIDIEHRNDLGDMCTKQLIFEMMGKYSNIIFTTSEDIIIDSIKRIPCSISSVREVLPGRKYTFPDELKKRDIVSENYHEFTQVLSESTETTMRTIFINYAGISPLIAQEICCRAKCDPDLPANNTNERARISLWDAIMGIIANVRESSFEPSVIMRKGEPIEFAPFYLKLYEAPEYEEESYLSVSTLLEYFYGAKDEHARIRQKASDIRKITTNALERAVKKYDLQGKQLKECSGKDKYKVYGDLLNTYGYSVPLGQKAFICENFYDDNKEISIPLDEHKSAIENAKRYFDKYSKLRRTEEALNEEIQKTESDIRHLQSILQAIDMSKNEGDLTQIRTELMDFGYIKRHDRKEKRQTKSLPLHFTSSEGFDIYVGKNNYQNEEVSFKLADGNDWWFHAKGVPGSHVIVKTGNTIDIPNHVFEEAAALAAFYSQNCSNEKVEVDYTQKKNLKRVVGAAPGFVIYHTNYSMVVRPKEQI